MVTVKLVLKADEETAQPDDMAQPLNKLGLAGLLDIRGITLVFECETVEEAEVLEERLDELLSDRPYSIGADIESKKKRAISRRKLSPGPSPLDRAGWN